MTVRRILAVLGALLAIIGTAVPAHAQPAPDVIEFSLPANVPPGEDITFTVRATNRGQNATSGSISISFPDQPRVSIVDSSPAQSRGSYAQVFQPGANVYNFTQNRTIPAQYPLAELYLMENWGSGQERYLTIRATAPSNRPTLAVQGRVTLRSSAGFFNFPVNGPADQQGFPVQLRLVPIQAPPPPPTATTPPPPTATTRPTLEPTRTPVPPTPTIPPPPTATVAVAGVRAAIAPTTPDPSPPDPGTSSGSTTILLAGLLVAAGLIAGGAIAFTRRPAIRPAPYTVPARSYPAPPRSYAPQSQPPLNASFPPIGGGAAPGPLPTGYQIVGAPKHGGMATVYKAFQPSLHRHVALKVLSPSLGSDPSFLQRFQSEARSTARLEHPNIVPIYDMGQANGSVFIVMRYIEGGTLQELLDRETRLPMNRAIHICAQVASALDYAHSQGFVHRDVKPANIMVEAGDRATLTDFGIAKAVGETRLTRTGSIVGTPEYLSPEQARGDQIDGRADLYALGIVVYEMLAGRTPFQAENPLSVVHQHLMTPPPPPNQFNPSIPSGVVAALLKVLAKEPGHRYPTGEAFVQALRRGAGSFG